MIANRAINSKINWYASIMERYLESFHFSYVDVWNRKFKLHFRSLRASYYLPCVLSYKGSFSDLLIFFLRFQMHCSHNSWVVSARIIGYCQYVIVWSQEGFESQLPVNYYKTVSDCIKLKWYLSWVLLRYDRDCTRMRWVFC